MCSAPSGEDWSGKHFGTGAGGTCKPSLETHGQAGGREEVTLFVKGFCSAFTVQLLYMCPANTRLHDRTSFFWLAEFCRRSLTSQCLPHPLHGKFLWRSTLPRTWCGTSASWRAKWRGWNAAFAPQNYSVSFSSLCTPALLQNPSTILGPVVNTHNKAYYAKHSIHTVLRTIFGSIFR